MGYVFALVSFRLHVDQLRSIRPKLQVAGLCWISRGQIPSRLGLEREANCRREQDSQQDLLYRFWRRWNLLRDEWRQAPEDLVPDRDLWWANQED